MKDESTHYGAMDKPLSEKQICVIMPIIYIVRKRWPYPPTTSGSYGITAFLTAGRQTGRQADKIRVDFKNF